MTDREANINPLLLCTALLFVHNVLLSAAPPQSGCCLEHRCCQAPIKTDQCKPDTTSYYYTYRNGTLTCDDEDESSCARRSCECDRTAVLCFQRYNYSEVYAKYLNRNKCSGRRPSCPEV
ncbi:phospholipase A2-like isoform X2 [Engystomops pustulosus]|uniref:phospholipase A2-like isoform X2 n=1 Tax=Engystomops pustulosus TaxID=76066 RepID=UPI003AFA6ADD